MSRRKSKSIKYYESDSEQEQKKQQKRQSKTSAKNTQKNKKKKQSSDDEWNVQDIQQSQYKEEEDEVVSLVDEKSDVEINQSEELVKYKSKQRRTVKSKANTNTKQKSSKTVKTQADEDDVTNIKEQHDDEFDYEDCLPYFIRPQHIKDAQGRRPDHPEYDNNTLSIPAQDYQKLSPLFRQFWNAKMINFNKIVLFKFGRWFHAFYMDAITIKKECGHKIGLWGKDRPCAMIYDSQYHSYLRILLTAGYQIVTVEQMEKWEIVHEDKPKDEIIMREISQVFSKGTFVDENEENVESEGLISLVFEQVEDKWKIGVSYCDCRTNQIIIDQFDDDKEWNQLRSLIVKLSPAEVVIMKNNLPIGCKQAIESLNPKMVFSQNNRDQFKSVEYIFNQLKMEFRDNQNDRDVKVQKDVNKGIYNKEEHDQEEKEIKKQKKADLHPDYPEIFSEMEKQWVYQYNQFQHLTKNEQEVLLYSKTNYSYFYTVQAIYNLLTCLRVQLLSDTVYRHSTISFIDYQFSLQQHMILDVNALQSLEIFQVNFNQSYKNEGSLFHFIDYCSTFMGRRILRQWVQMPLINIPAIQQRQQNVSNLMKRPEIAEEFSKEVSKAGDLEQKISKIFNFQIRYLQLNSIKMWEALKYIYNTLQAFKKGISAIKLLEQSKIKLHIKEWQQLDIQELDDFIYELLAELTVENDKVMASSKNQSKELASIQKQIYDLEKDFDDELERWKKMCQTKDMQYCHLKLRYQMEIPESVLEHMDKKTRSELTLISKRKGYLRFHTQFIEKRLTLEKKLRFQFEQAMIPFVQNIIDQLKQQKIGLQYLIKVLSTIDATISLAHCSSKMTLKCFADFTSDSIFKLQQISHPCLKTRINNFVPNDVIFNDNITTLLLTGPNMGGKSTLLRQVAIATILAQIGCMVPAQSFILHPVTRIFCRIGAADRLLEGKSTFYIELEETKQILSKADQNSLVLIDELGRGTSTFDGMAIAYGVLKYMVEVKKAKMVFSTHYHMLVEEMKLYPNVRACFMNYIMKDKTIQFEYKLVDGSAIKSFASNVADMVGIPEAVIKNAEQISNQVMGNSKYNQILEMSKKFNNIIEKLNKND